MGENGSNWHKKREKSQTIEKKAQKKIPNLINAQDLIITQGGLFSKNNECTVSNKKAQGGF